MSALLIDVSALPINEKSEYYLRGKTMKGLWLGFLGAFIVLGAASSAFPMTDKETKEKAKAILEKHKDAIVSVKAVVKQNIAMGMREMGGWGGDRKIEVGGTMINAQGLVVTSYGQIDFSHYYEMFGRMGGGEEDDPKLKASITVEDVKIVLNDGKELEAEIVLKDKDLDLAFIRPKKTKDLNLAHLELKAAAEPKILDEYVAIGRSSRETGRAPMIWIGEIAGVLKKPRTYYMASGYGLGVPVFDLSGNVLGLYLNRRSSSREDSADYLSSGPAVLPTADVLEIMKQIPEPKSDEAPKEEPKKEEPKKE